MKIDNFLSGWDFWAISTEETFTAFRGSVVGTKEWSGYQKAEFLVKDALFEFIADTQVKL